MINDNELMTKCGYMINDKKKDHIDTTLNRLWPIHGHKHNG